MVNFWRVFGKIADLPPHMYLVKHALKAHEIASSRHGDAILIKLSERARKKIEALGRHPKIRVITEVNYPETIHRFVSLLVLPGFSATAGAHETGGKVTHVKVKFSPLYHKFS